MDQKRAFAETALYSCQKIQIEKALQAVAFLAVAFLAVALQAVALQAVAFLAAVACLTSAETVGIVADSFVHN